MLRQLREEDRLHTVDKPADSYVSGICAPNLAYRTACALLN